MVRRRQRHRCDGPSVRALEQLDGGRSHRFRPLHTCALRTHRAPSNHADRDDSGARLDADCTYEIVGRGPAADWWSLAAYDMAGRLMANPANRYTVSSPGVLRTNNGQYRVRVSRTGSPGNWLPIESDYRFRLVLRVYRPQYVSEREVVDREAEQLPSIRKVSC